MFVTHRRACIVGAAFLIGSLLLHDWNLHPTLRPFLAPLLSFLRFILLVIPLWAGWMLTKKKGSRLQKILLWTIWFLFLPYTIYTVTVVRHIAERCRLPVGFYTEFCVDRLWTLYPVFIYALAGTLIFIFSLSQVATKTFLHSARKQTFILSVSFYASLASIFGLYSRLNIWAVFTKPRSFFEELITLFSHPAFFINVFIFWIFTIFLFFIINRVFDQARSYIFPE